MNYLNFSALKFHVVWNVIDPIEIDSHEGTSEAVSIWVAIKILWKVLLPVASKQEET